MTWPKNPTPDGSGEPAGSLVGLRVIDAGTMVAGPFVASLLADFGADVLKIEHPTRGDPMRNWGPFRDGAGLTWKVTARNKRLVTLDLTHERGREIFMRLVADADVLVENFRPGTLERWRLGWDVLSALNPRLVMVRVSGYGQDGPYREKPGYGTVAEAMSGIPSFTGFPDGPPTLSAFALADTVAGLFGVIGALMGLYEMAHNGEGVGQVVDVSLYEPLFRLVESQVIGYDQLGVVKKRRGNRIEEDVPRNAYGTQDERWIVISASSNETFRRLMTAIGRPELADDTRFAANHARIQNDDVLDALISEWFAARSFEEAMATLDRCDVIAGPILTIRDIWAHPQYLARGNIVEVPDDHFGVVRMPGVTPRFSRTPGAVRFTGQEKGRHNEEVFIGGLGMSATELQALKSEGVI